MDNVKHMWCKEHGHKDTEAVCEMYMKLPHNHPEWKAHRESGRLAWNEGRKDKRAAKHKAPEFGPDPASSTSAKSTTLSLATSFKTALTSKVRMSDVEARYFVEQAVKEAENKDRAKNLQAKD